jgi:hypothetical protein
MPMKLLGTSAALVAATVILIMPSAATANDSTCVGLLTGTHDNVVVPPGAACTLVGATVEGNVKALERSTLFVFASTIKGDVQGDKTREVRVQFESQVGGDVQVKGTAPDSFNAVDINVRVGGDVQFEESAGIVFIDTARIGGDVTVIKHTGRVEAEFNTVGGEVKIEDNVIDARGMSVLRNEVMGNMGVFKNTGPGPKDVAFNTVRENLQCFENAPPFVGGPNAAGKAEGQCF